MIEVAKLKTIFPELSHSLDFAGDLTSVKHMNLHTVWKGEWGRVPASSSVIFFLFLPMNMVLEAFAFSAWPITDVPRCSSYFRGHQKADHRMSALFMCTENEVVWSCSQDSWWSQHRVLDAVVEPVASWLSSFPMAPIMWCYYQKQFRKSNLEYVILILSTLSKHLILNPFCLNGRKWFVLPVT